MSLPPRQYDLAGGLLAEAVDRATTDGVPVDQALHAAARDTGRGLDAAARDEVGARPTRAGRRDAVVRALERNGYEPYLDAGEILLANCPFHALAEQHRTLFCGMNSTCSKA